MKIKIKPEWEFLYRGTLIVDTIYEVEQAEPQNTMKDYFKVIRKEKYPTYVQKVHCIPVEEKQIINLVERETIEISYKKHFTGKDGIYCAMYNCPKCKETILIGYGFCPECGSELKWVK